MKLPPTTYDDLKKVAQFPKFIPYKTIMPYITSINELLPASLILYESNGVGHWCAVFENEEGVNYFDSQGGYIDDPLAHVDEILTYTYLRQLLAMQNKPVIFNDHKLQRLKYTCGYWCAVRLLFKDMKCDEFAKMFMGYSDRDMKIYKYFRWLNYIL